MRRRSLAALVLLLGLAACGIKAPPRPPAHRPEAPAPALSPAPPAETP